MKMLTAAVLEEQYRDRLAAQWTGSFTVLAFLFVQPDSEAIQVVDSRGEYLNIRSGQTWDLFFPGYYQSNEPASYEAGQGAAPVGTAFARNWYFRARDFNTLRTHVERNSQGRWRYSGETDLVLAGCYVSDADPVVDWDSVISGQLTDPVAASKSMTLGMVIEAISQDLELGTEDASYGVGKVTNATQRTADDRAHPGRDFMVATLAEIGARLTAMGLGLS